MRRVVSLWLPTWPTDRLRRQGLNGLPDSAPLVTRVHDGRRLAVAAADRAAQGLGLYAGMPLAQAQALVAGLTITDADPAGDAAALAELAGWCLRYTPLTAPDAPDGVWLDVTGCTHSWSEAGGEATLLHDLTARLERAGVAARAAIADTPGAAHALARFAAEPVAAAPPGRAGECLAPLPVAALRLDAESVALLRRLGLETVGALLGQPRGPFTRRFGPALMRRLDQALGREAEPVTPVMPPAAPQHRLAFAEPLLTVEAFAAAIAMLTEAVCAQLDQSGQGALRLDLLFERVDGTMQAVRIGAARPVRAPRYLARLLVERLETVDPGLGVEAMRLVATLTGTQPAEQECVPLPGETEAEPDLTLLLDRLQNRFGAARVYRMEPVESDIPERSVRQVAPHHAGPDRVPPLMASPRESGGEAIGRNRHRAAGLDRRAPARRGLAMTIKPTNACIVRQSLYPRPVRLLSAPQPIQALSVLPDHPPAAFVWRRVRHRVRRADGPERITGEWWRDAQEVAAVRDYWTVEDETGRRFWVFRSGDGDDPATGDLSWYLHGLF